MNAFTPGAAPDPIDGPSSTRPTPADPSSIAQAPSKQWLLERTEALCRVDTTTGQEDRGLPALRELLSELGARVELQEVAPGRHNVLATWGHPKLLLSTHLDTVPPYLPPERRGDTLTGRGTCDAKGQITAQLGAIVSLLARGFDGLAWLGVVGEETDSIGADAAAALAPRFSDCVAVINSEPTDCVLATGQRGSLQLQLSTDGVAAHSGMPELGRSAIWPLIDWLSQLRSVPSVRDVDLGDEVWNLGTMQAGQAPNIVPASAEATVFVRWVRGSTFVEQAERFAPTGAKIEVLSSAAPEVFDRLPGFEHVVVPFGSDAPRLRRLVGSGRVVLCGPGSIEVAHTANEQITGAELLRGCEQLVEVAIALLLEADE